MDKVAECHSSSMTENGSVHPFKVNERKDAEDSDDRWMRKLENFHRNMELG